MITPLLTCVFYFHPRDGRKTSVQAFEVKFLEVESCMRPLEASIALGKQL
jgi:hypothetical protein